jgi:hypothetical protein
VLFVNTKCKKQIFFANVTCIITSLPNSFGVRTSTQNLNHKWADVENRGKWCPVQHLLESSNFLSKYILKGCIQDLKVIHAIAFKPF